MARGAHAAKRQRRRLLQRQRAAHRARDRAASRLGEASLDVGVEPGADESVDGLPSEDLHAEGLQPVDEHAEELQLDPVEADALQAEDEHAEGLQSDDEGPGARSHIFASALLFLLVAAAATVLTVLAVGRDSGPDVATRSDTPAALGPAQDTLLLVRHSGEGPAEGMTLLAAGREDEGAAALLLPVGTLVDIPGVGLDRLGLAQQYGGPALAQATVENLLGIEIDEIAIVDERGLGTMLGRAGGFSVTVPERLVTRADDGTAQVRFEPGEQFLDGRRLAEYWGFTARGEDELSAFSRQQQVLTRWLDELTDEATFEAVVAGGMPQLDTTADREWVRQLLADLVDARRAEALRVTLLPVESFGGEGPDGGSTFRPRTEAIGALIADLFGGSVPATGAGGALRVQVLNGVGVPGVGELVDRRLGGGSFRVVLTDNARDFDFAETRILVYDESSRSMQAAELVQERLGVGTIQVSRQLQSVVDLTIVVGADFLETEPGAGTAPQEPEADEE